MIATLCAVLLWLLLPVPPAVAQTNFPGGVHQAPVAPAIAGTWRGTYFYPRADMAPVEFTVTISGTPDNFSGRMWEPNTFGDRIAPQLTADIWGRMTPKNEVSFTKKYDGTGGVSHSVSYEGTFDEGRQTIEGRWRAGPANSGAFRMNRQ